MNKIKYIIYSMCLTLSIVANASTECPKHYLSGKEPTFINLKLSEQLNEVCFSEFAVIHSGKTRTPLWSAEKLTSSRVLDAMQLKREDNFYPEIQIPKERRAVLEDYAKSGFDRGHLAPNKDFSVRESANESFSLANIIPQEPSNNRGIWADIEVSTRKMALDFGEVYVVTGPMFKSLKLKTLRNRVVVPTHIFKAIYIPKLNKASAYVVENIVGKEYGVVSIAELNAYAGLDLFPSLTTEIKNEVVGLYPPMNQLFEKEMSKKMKEKQRNIKKQPVKTATKNFLKDIK